MFLHQRNSTCVLGGSYSHGSLDAQPTASSLENLGVFQPFWNCQAAYRGPIFVLNPQKSNMHLHIDMTVNKK